MATATRFHVTRRSAVRRARPWNRLAYIIRALPEALSALVADIQPPAGGRVLDFGCADVPYRHLFPADVEYLAADLEGNPDANTVIAAGGKLPQVADASVDSILSTQVLEHVTDPAVYLAECARVAKPGARMLLSTHGYMVWHPDPVDLWRWTNEGLRKQVEEAGFHVIRFEGIMGLAATGLQLFQDGIAGRLPRRFFQPLLALIMQSLIAVADRLQSPDSKRMNALVFALVAERRRAMAGPQLLSAFADAYPKAAFAEIGSNDGEQHDHLRPFILERGWHGVMVEPVPYIFDRLRSNYSGVDRVALENAAIADRDGELPFYHLRDAAPEERAGLPDWYDGIGSFNRDTILAHVRDMPDVAERVVEARVPALTFDSLVAKHALGPIDLVVIDTEGYDAEIIRSIDFTRHRPKLMLYEHYHLDAATRASTRALLEAAGYLTMEEGFDTFCVEPSSAIAELFRGLEPGVRGIAKYEE